MSDLDFIDSIVDQCLGGGLLKSEDTMSVQQQQQQQARPSSASAVRTRQPVPATAADIAPSSPVPNVPMYNHQQSRGGEPQGYAPPSWSQQQAQPSSSLAMPSPVPRDTHNAISMPSAEPPRGYEQQQYQHHQAPHTPSSARQHHTQQSMNNYNAGPSPNENFTTGSDGGGGAHYTSGGGRPIEYNPPHPNHGASPTMHSPTSEVREYTTSSRNNGQGPPSAGDAALRRIQMWEEKKRLKQAIAKRELENRGNEECTFRPNVQAARESVLAAKLGLTQQRGGKGSSGTVGFGYGGGNNGLTVGTRIPIGANVVTTNGSGDREDLHQRSLALSNVTQAIMTPSRLYKDNKAWGYDSFVDRQTYAREMKRQQEEDAAAVFALKNPDRPLRVTVPEPFEFGNKGRKAVKKTLEPPSASIVQRVKREQNDFYAEDSSAYDLHHSTSGAYFNTNDSSDHYYSRQYRATDTVTAPSVPAGLFSLHASNMMLEYAPASSTSPHSPSRGPNGNGGRL